MKRRLLTACFVLLVAGSALNFIGHAQAACGTFLCGWSSSFTQTNGTDNTFFKVVLSNGKGDGSPGNPYQQYAGQAFAVNLGYTSKVAATQNVYTWTQIPGVPVTGGSIGVGTSDDGSAAATGLMNYCYTMVFPNGTKYYNPFWSGGGGGNVTCQGNADMLCYTNNYQPAVGCTAADPSPNGSISGGPAGSPTANGGSVIWYQPGGSGTKGKHTFTLSFSSAAPGSEFCFRTHVSLSSSSWPGPSSPGDFSAGTKFAQNDLPDVEGMDASSSHCFQFISPLPPPTAASSCNETSYRDLGSMSPAVMNSFGPPTVIAPDGSTRAPDGSTWSTKQNYIDTGSDNTVYTHSEVIVTSGGVTLVDENVGHDYTTAKKTWKYDPPPGQTVTVQFINREHLLSHNGNQYWVTYASSSATYTCYSARCTITSVTGDGPGGNIISGPSGGTAHVSATITNDNTPTSQNLLPTLGGAPLSITSGVAHPVSTGGLSPGQTSSPPTTFDVAVAPGSTPTTMTISAYPDYYGNFVLGPACTKTVNVYMPFSLDPNAVVNLVDASGAVDTEAPTQVQNTTSVTESGAGPVKENVTSSLSNTCGAAVPAGLSSSGPFSSGTTYFYGSATSTTNYSVCAPPDLGDQYCATIKVDRTSLPGNTAYLGPGGSTDIIGGGTKTSQNCQDVSDKPFYKVYGSTAAAAGGYPTPSDPNCSTGGEIAGWNNDSGTNPGPQSGAPTMPDYGASSQLGAYAWKDITGFASAQSPNYTRPPSDLTFANEGTTNSGAAIVTNTDAYSPSLGGYDKIRGGVCSTALSPTMPTSPAPAAIPTTSGSYEHDGNIAYLFGASVPSGQNVTLYVKGDVYLGANIVYGSGGASAGSGGAGNVWSLSGTATNVPSFTLIATGNIYIGPDVTELDGLYTSETDGTAAGSAGGEIYTCGRIQSATNFARYNDSDDMVHHCNKQLTVYGSFVANKIDMLREYGSLRDEAPTAPAGSVDITKNGINFDAGKCNPLPGNPWNCNTNTDFTPEPDGSAVFDYSNYQSQYTFAGAAAAASGYKLTINFGNHYGSWELGESYPGGSGYKYDVEVDVNGTPIPGGDLPLDPTTNSYTVSLPSVPANPVITLKWKNDIVIGSGGNAWDANFEIRSLELSKSAGAVGAPRVTSPCSNKSTDPGYSPSSPETCAAEVFKFSPEFYLSNPNIELPSGGVSPFNSISSLPPIL